MTAADRLLDWLGRRLASHLAAEIPGEEPFVPSNITLLRQALRPGDVLLVAGTSRLSGAIKYLTHSHWSHAALYIGERPELPWNGNEKHVLVEVDVGVGCISSPLTKYARFHTRICRAVGLTETDQEAVASFMISHLGTQYDMRNVIDLARYLFPTPPVPRHLRRRMIALGSGDPTRSICSTLIAEAFERIHYPILPQVEYRSAGDEELSEFRRQEILHIRDHSLYVPADFDFSPYFMIIKPTIQANFDYKSLVWAPVSTPPADSTPKDIAGAGSY